MFSKSCTKFSAIKAEKNKREQKCEKWLKMALFGSFLSN
jgi:hypothetical protein